MDQSTADSRKVKELSAKIQETGGAIQRGRSSIKEKPLISDKGAKKAEKLGLLYDGP